MLEFIIFIVGVVVAFVVLTWLMRLRMHYNRCFQMVFLKISIPRKDSKEDKEADNEQYSASKDFKEVVGIANHLFESIHGIYSKLYRKRVFLGQDFLSLEYVVMDNLIDFYIVCPNGLRDLVEKQVTAYYPDSFVEQVGDYNIFRKGYKIVGRYLTLSKNFIYPLKTIQRMNSDPLNNITNALSKLSKEDGAAIQIVVRPVVSSWQEKGRKKAEKLFTSQRESPLTLLKPLMWLGNIINIMAHGPTQENMTENMDTNTGSTRTTPMTDEQVKAMEEKATKPGFETVIRLVVSSKTKHEAQVNFDNILNSFQQYTTTDNNSFDYTLWHTMGRFINNFMLRSMNRSWSLRLTHRKSILCSEELASLYHLPNIKYNKAPTINWLNFKIAPAPANLPSDGVLLGQNVFRGSSSDVFIQPEDRFRHFYVIGQTGTGKSSILQVMIRQDLKNGHGICVVDPHGSLVEDILPFIPRERADDVIIFNPGDLERPMGINLLEGETDEEKELVALDAMNIMIKMFNEEVFGPRIQDYFRNGCLTLMADPDGGALTDIVRLFTDDEYQKYKVTKVKNPIIMSFWKDQMAKTGAREKQEMIPYFSAKFGQFVTNTMMRNIIGQSKSSFDFAKVMNEGKILLMNLSKGITGDVNSKLLGLIIVSKIQMAAMRRQKLAKEDRRDFFLYIDEFQNYVTDSIESILSEARKYRLGLIMAHQYIAQLESDKKGGGVDLKDAVFGNVGSIMSYKIGAQDAEYMAKEMAPVFSEQDLINIDKYKAVMKLAIDGQPSKPFSIVPVNPYLETGDAKAAEAFKQLSRLKYGRDKDFVDREIYRRIGATQYAEEISKNKKKTSL